MLLCGAATAAAGPIGFVGLTVPHVARALVGHRLPLDPARTRCCSAPVLLLAADVLGPGHRPPRRGPGRHRHRRRSGRPSSSCWSAATGWPACDRVRAASADRRHRAAGRRRRFRAPGPPARADALGHRLPRAGVALVVVVARCAHARRLPAPARTSSSRPWSARARPPRSSSSSACACPGCSPACWSASASGCRGPRSRTCCATRWPAPTSSGSATAPARAAVLGILLLGWTGFAVSGAALAGALVSAGRDLRPGLARRALGLPASCSSGSGSSSLMLAVVDYLMTRAECTRRRPRWSGSPGSLNGSSAGQLHPLALACLVLVPADAADRPGAARPPARRRRRRLRGAAGRGRRLAAIVLGVMLAAVATAAAGPVGFVAFVAGPIAKRLTRGSGPSLVPAALVGALVVRALRRGGPAPAARRAARRRRHRGGRRAVPGVPADPVEPCGGGGMSEARGPGRGDARRRAAHRLETQGLTLGVRGPAGASTT